MIMIFLSIITTWLITRSAYYDNKLYFVNIDTNQFYSNNNWDSIAKIEGLNKIEYFKLSNSIYNEGAVIETINSIRLNKYRSKKEELGFKKAKELFWLNRFIPFFKEFN